MSSLSGIRRRIGRERFIEEPTALERRKARILTAQRRGASEAEVQALREEGRTLPKGRGR